MSSSSSRRLLSARISGAGPQCGCARFVGGLRPRSRRRPTRPSLSDDELARTVLPGIGAQAGHQHDRELQTLGLMHGHDAHHVLALGQAGGVALVVPQVAQRADEDRRSRPGRAPPELSKSAAIRMSLRMLANRRLPSGAASRQRS